jgi:hypothetical protein
MVYRNRVFTLEGHSLYTMLIFSSSKGSDTMGEESGILRVCRIDGISISNKTSEPNLFKMTFSSYKYCFVHQLTNSGKGKIISTA